MFKRTVTVQVEANVAWQGFRDPDSGNWIAVCRPLNLNAVGETWAELHQCAAEAMGLLLTDLLEEGELDQFLYEHGWRLQNPLPEPGRRVQFDVPFSLRKTTPNGGMVPA